MAPIRWVWVSLDRGEAVAHRLKRLRVRLPVAVDLLRIGLARFELLVACDFVSNLSSFLTLRDSKWLIAFLLAGLS